MSGSVEDNKRLVREYIDKVVNTGNIDEIGDYISPDYVEVYRNKRHPAGVEGARAHILGVRRTYPDLHVVVDRQIGEGDWVVSQITARGTHEGEWMGIKPTGKAVEFTGVNVDRIEGGLIVEHDGAANLLETLLEIGAICISGSGEE